MSTEVKNIILLGGTSLLGKGFVEYITTIDHPFTVTITSRNPQPPSWIPSNDPRFKLVNVDFSSHESLVSALKGQDAAVALLGVGLLDRQPAVVDAAIEAGVKIFMPAEFGIDVSDENPKLKNFISKPAPFFKIKLDNNNYVKQRAAEGKIALIRIINPVFFDWALPIGLLGFNLNEKKARLFSGGNMVVNSITTAKVGEAIARVFLNPKPYLNGRLDLATIKYTQNEVLRLIEAKTGSKFEIESTTSDAAIAFGEELCKTDPMGGGFAMLSGFIYDDKEDFGPSMTREDAEKLGLKEDDVKTVVERVLAAA